MSELFIIRTAIGREDQVPPFYSYICSKSAGGKALYQSGGEANE